MPDDDVRRGTSTGTAGVPDLRAERRPGSPRSLGSMADNQVVGLSSMIWRWTSPKWFVRPLRLVILLTR